MPVAIGETFRNDRFTPNAHYFIQGQYGCMILEVSLTPRRSTMERFTISLEESLAQQFDQLVV